ncbi:Glucose dehydrogenase [Eumeta japonica]|uniref:Glucose dehydrogenase n=1 Tax=Eumeta variegata TaxID=151549 RepID=A0A4C2A3N7_EUMVA|nr:Glucose dehydrogenase [Eumeta japonica]
MLKSFENLGTDFMPDTNIPNPMGRGRFVYQVTDEESIRSCVANTYLVNIKNKGKLDVLKNALVSKLIIKDKTAIGVEIILECGTKIKAYARKEVVLSAGTFNTPQLLLLSGIGPKAELEKLGIPVVLDQPKVGKNLQDHAHVPIAVVGGPSAADTLEVVMSLLELKTFPLPMTTSLFNVNKGPKEQSPEIQTITLNFGAASPLYYYFCHITFNFNLTVCNSFFKDTLLREVYYTLTVLNDPLSRGEVTLRSTDIKDPPIIKPMFFNNTMDLITLSKAAKKVYELKSEYYEKVGGCFSRPPLSECDDLEFGCDDYWICYTRIMSSTTYHPAGTCAMGSDGVTDSDLKVRGIKNLRVVDASVIPKLPTDHTNSSLVLFPVSTPPVSANCPARYPLSNSLPVTVPI